MEAYLVFIVTLVVGLIWLVRRRWRMIRENEAEQERRLQQRLQQRAISLKGAPTATEMIITLWFTGWLTNHRQPSGTLIDRKSIISEEEVEEGLETAMRHFERHLLRSTDIQTVGDFIDELYKQLKPKRNEKKNADSNWRF